MPSIPFGIGDWESASQNVTRLKLRNMYSVDNPSSADKISRVSRPTLKTVFTCGSGPIDLVWQQNNTFNSDLLVVSGSQLFRVSSTTFTPTLLGTIAGTGHVEIAGLQDEVYLVRGNVLHKTNGTTVTTIPLPDSQPAESVATINGYIIVTVRNSQKFYWLEPGDLTFKPLNFASAVRIPDVIKAVRVVGDEIWFLGAAGPEVWVPTDDPDAPFQRTAGRVYLEGCLDKSTVVLTSIDGLPSLIWITDAKAVVAAQASPKKISNESVEELLRQSSGPFRCWSFRFNRHDFYLINCPDFTLVYDITKDVWPRWDSFGYNFWKPTTAAQILSSVYCGCSLTNKVYELEEGLLDDNTDAVVREVSGYVPWSGLGARCAEVLLYVNAGWSPSYPFVPKIELRWSDNMGTTWSDWKQAPLGNRGKFKRSVSFRSLGFFQDPGRVFEVRVSEPVRFRLDYGTVNERFEPNGRSA